MLKLSTSPVVLDTLKKCKRLRVVQQKAFSSYNKNNFKKALHYVDVSLNYAPASIEHKLLKAECLILLGRIEDGDDLLVSCIEGDSSNAEAVYVRGLYLFHTDNLHEALLCFERALILDPTNKKAMEMKEKAVDLKEKSEREIIPIQIEEEDHQRASSDTNVNISAISGLTAEEHVPPAYVGSI